MTNNRGLRVATVTVAAAMLVAIFAHGVSAQPETATAVVVNTDGDGLNLREAPGLDAAVLTVMPEGATVDVLATDIYDISGRSWSEVSYEGLVGYSASAYLLIQPVEEAPAPEAPSVPENPTSVSTADLWWLAMQATVSGTGGDGLNLRAEPGLDAWVITGLPEGAPLAVVGAVHYDWAGNAWYQVDVDGTVGWVYGAYVQRTDAAIGAATAAEALGYLGAPYVWAGTTPDGFDCSGFTYFIVNQVLGNDFPRAIYEQVERGEYVAIEDLQVGDLVFHQNTFEAGLSHVGIYIGNGEFISAVDEDDGVAIRNLWDSYWIERYFTARRVR